MQMTHELQMGATGTIFIVETWNSQTLFPMPIQFLITTKKNDKNLITTKYGPLKETLKQKIPIFENNNNTIVKSIQINEGTTLVALNLISSDYVSSSPSSPFDSTIYSCSSLWRQQQWYLIHFIRLTQNFWCDLSHSLVISREALYVKESQKHCVNKYHLLVFIFVSTICALDLINAQKTIILYLF